MDLHWKKIGRALAWCIPVLLLVATIFWYRAGGGQPPVPFLLLAAAIVFASFGGMLAGICAGVIAAAFVLYATAIGYGPPSLTGDFVRAAAGCMLYLFVGGMLGRTRDQNSLLIRELTAARNSLEETVRKRTLDLQAANEDLHAEVKEHHRISRELEKSEVLLRHSQRLDSLGIMAGGIAHDFNNLLTSIKANSSLLITAIDDIDALKKLEEIDQATARATQLCKQMLSYAGEKHDEHSATDIGQLVNETIGFARALVTRKIQFNLQCEKPIVVSADSSLIEQVVLNLLINGAEAIENTGTVSAVVRIAQIDGDELSGFLLSESLRPGQYVSIEISDNGEGMSAEKITRIFDPFFSSKFAGRGLGLAVVFGAARSHGGAIQVRSEPGSGSTFHFILPYVADQLVLPIVTETEASGSDSVLGPGQDDGQRKTILVVDDQDAVRRVSVMVLRLDGWPVIEAKDGAEAVECCRTHGASLGAVVLDMTMPIMSGTEALEKISVLDPNLPVILTSGYKPETIDGVQPTAFLAKPFNAKELLNLVAQVARSNG